MQFIQYFETNFIYLHLPSLFLKTSQAFQSAAEGKWYKINKVIKHHLIETFNINTIKEWRNKPTELTLNSKSKKVLKWILFFGEDILTSADSV